MASALDFMEATRSGELNEALKECDSARSRFHVMFWLLNNIKWMDAPSASGWKKTAERLRKMTTESVSEEAARIYSTRFNKSSLRGWQDLLMAATALEAGVEYCQEHDDGLERLLDNAHADKNKAAIDKWEHTKALLEPDRTDTVLQKFIGAMQLAIQNGSSPVAALRFLDALPYGPNAETKEQRKTREAKQAIADEEEDDF